MWGLGFKLTVQGSGLKVPGFGFGLRGLGATRHCNSSKHRFGHFSEVYARLQALRGFEQSLHIGALIIRKRFRGPLYYILIIIINKEPQNSIGLYIKLRV